MHPSYPGPSPGCFNAWTKQAPQSRPFRFVVADRPNPLGGDLVEGPLLDVACCASGYGYLPIPHLHGMTMGELARLFDSYLPHRLSDLRVVATTGWHRGMQWDATGLVWIPPSPNLPTFLSALAYGATVFIEATTVAEGRGTTTPFTLFGAPFINASALAAAVGIGGGSGGASSGSRRGEALFRQAYFEPTFSKYNGTDCAGVQWLRDVSPRFQWAVRILRALRAAAAPPSAFAWDGSWFGHPGSELIDEYAGTPRLREMLDAGAGEAEILAAFAPEARAFRAARQPFLLEDYN